MSGNGKRASAPPPVATPEDLAVEAAVRHHTASYMQVCGERDALQKVNDRQEQMLTVAKIEIEGLRAALGEERSRTASYQTERDEAVAVSAGWESLFIDISAMLRARQIPAAPHIREKTETP